MKPSGFLNCILLLCIFLTSCSQDMDQMNMLSGGNVLNSVTRSNNMAAPAARIAGLGEADIRSYLHYYAPVILKQAEEPDDEHRGYDWMTNFFYDNDTYLANNKENWSEELENYILNNQHTDWQIRPTLYSSAILFHDNELNTNSLILLYHIYHAKQRYSIHDWERIEIRVDGIAGAPGSGEAINYVVITRHSLHNAREYPGEDLNFMETTDGKHVLIWQANWDFSLTNPCQAELHFVEDSWSTIESKINNDKSAKVDINGEGDTRFHYVFVDNADPEAVNYWNAQNITQRNANSLTSGKSHSTTVKMSGVKRIQYELQDIADIIPPPPEYRQLGKCFTNQRRRSGVV